MLVNSSLQSLRSGLRHLLKKLGSKGSENQGVFVSVRPTWIQRKVGRLDFSILLPGVPDIGRH